MMENLGETREDMNRVSKMEEVVKNIEAGARAEIMMPALEAMEASLENNMVKRVQEVIAKTEEGSRGVQGESASASLHIMSDQLKSMARREPNIVQANKYALIYY